MSLRAYLEISAAVHSDSVPSVAGVVVGVYGEPRVDVADVGRFLETYTIDSWLELMHQQERVTNADEMLENRVRHLLTGASRVTFCVASERPHWTWRTQSDGAGLGYDGTLQV
jgi:hypothetical protein